jgi:hypothetical protein
MMINFVFDVMAARNRSKGKLSESSDCTRVRPEVMRLIDTSYIKKVGVQMSASSPSSRNAHETR